MRGLGDPAVGSIFTVIFGHGPSEAHHLLAEVLLTDAAMHQRPAIAVDITPATHRFLPSGKPRQRLPGFETAAIGGAMPDAGLPLLERVDRLQPQPGSRDPQRIAVDDPGRAAPGIGQGWQRQQKKKHEETHEAQIAPER